MKILKILVLFIMMCSGDTIEFPFSKNANNYGPYIFYLNKYETCQGPKSKSWSNMTAQIFTNKTSTFVLYNITVYNSVRITEVKINVYYYNGSQKTTLWNYKVDKPCQHFAIGNLLAVYLSAPSNCVVNKAELSNAVDFVNIAHQFFGKSFFYGVFLLKVVILASQGNFMCSLITVEFRKKCDI